MIYEFKYKFSLSVRVATSMLMTDVGDEMC